MCMLWRSSQCSDSEEGDWNDLSTKNMNTGNTGILSFVILCSLSYWLWQWSRSCSTLTFRNFCFCYEYMWSGVECWSECYWCWDWVLMLWKNWASQISCYKFPWPMNSLDRCSWSVSARVDSRRNRVCRRIFFWYLPPWPCFSDWRSTSTPGWATSSSRGETSTSTTTSSLTTSHWSSHFDFLYVGRNWNTCNIEIRKFNTKWYFMLLISQR